MRINEHVVHNCVHRDAAVNVNCLVDGFRYGKDGGETLARVQVLLYLLQLGAVDDLISAGGKAFSHKRDKLLRQNRQNRGNDAFQFCEDGEETVCVDCL